MSYILYEAPPQAFASMRIDQISTLAGMRLCLLREFSHIRNVYDATAADACIQTYIDYSRKCPEVNSITSNVDSDAVSYWLLKIAFSQFEEASAWHLHCEQCLLLARLPERWKASEALLRGKFSLRTARTVDFGSAQDLADAYLQIYPNAQCTEPEDFTALSFAIPTFNFALAGRRFFIENYNYFTALNLARFGYMYMYSTDKCQHFIQIVYDADFVAAMRRIYVDRLGSSLDQIAQPGDMKLAGLEQDLRKGLFPPCMMRIVREMQRKGHLHHYGRIQLYLFLRDAGMTMDDTMELFKQCFTYNGKLSLEKFSKEYAYNIKHVYGKAGQGGKSHCFGCERIIENVPTPEYAHGCPFRVLDPTAVALMYCKENKRLDLEEVLSEIKGPVAAKNYTSACNHLFFKIFGSGMKFPNPLRWVTDAREIESAGQSGVGVKE